MKISEKNKDFFKDVHDVVRLIPVGKVTSYGAIARYLSTPRASRMVGWAMNAAANQPDIPAHRVVNRNGLLSGKMHFTTPEEMELRLLKEGVNVKNDEIVNFNDHFWDPNEALRL